MSLARSLILLALVLVTGLWPGGRAATGDSAGAGNDFYRVFVEDGAGADGEGTFTATTGPSHPRGGDQPILFGDDSPFDAATSYLTVRSYTTGTDYVQTTSGPTSANRVVGLDEFASVAPLGATGYRTTYELPGGDRSPDLLTITSDISAEGATFAGSAIRISATVSNSGPIPVALGIRYLLDVAPAGDDGPALTLGASSGQLSEKTYRPAPEAVELIADGVAVHLPLLVRTPTVAADQLHRVALADTLKFAYWPDAFGSAFDYASIGRDIASPGGLDDSALLYYFGSTEEGAIRLAPGETATVSISVSGAGTQEICGNQADDDGDGLADAADPDCAPQPTPTPSPPANDGSPTPAPTRTPSALPRTGGTDRRLR